MPKNRGGATPRRPAAKRVKQTASERAWTQGGGQLRITQIRSGIGHPPVHRKTLAALGLKHHQDVVVQKDHPAIRGMLEQVRHLVAVTPVTAEE